MNGRHQITVLGHFINPIHENSEHRMIKSVYYLDIYEIFPPNYHL